MEVTIIKELISAAIAALLMYIGFINTLRTKVAVLEDNVEELQEECKKVTEKFEDMAHRFAVQEANVKRIESRQDSHSKKYDELMSTINELKIEMVKQFSRLTSELNAFNSMIEASDKGVKVTKRKK